MGKPVRVINSVAPIRINDLGGWTDTWFAEYGAVLNIGVYPYIQCQMAVFRARRAVRERVIIDVENYGARLALEPGRIVYDEHPLLEAAVDIMRIPKNIQIRVNIYSAVPGGCSTGTSASVSLALIGALDTLTPGRMTPAEAAAKAHEIETVKLRQQCGIQDQLCAAYGGICYIQMDRYPKASVSQLWLPNSQWWELENRLCLIYMGRTHSSSEVHKQVIAELEDNTPQNPKLQRLRDCAEKGKNALYDGDLRAFGRAMIENTEAQGALHAALISSDMKQAIAVAKAHGALGWKVNGAGGEGGSLTILAARDPARKRRMIREIESIGPRIANIPIYLSRYGLRVWDSPVE